MRSTNWVCDAIASLELANFGDQGFPYSHLRGLGRFKVVAKVMNTACNTKENNHWNAVSS